MSTYDQWFPSNYFKADDLDTGPLALTITGIEPEKMQTGELKPCIKFKEDRRRLVLNKTNKDTLVLVTRSTNPADAVGQRVQLVQVPATFAGKATKGIRISAAPLVASRPKAGAAKGAPAAARPKPADEVDPDLNDEIPY